MAACARTPQEEQPITSKSKHAEILFIAPSAPHVSCTAQLPIVRWYIGTIAGGLFPKQNDVQMSALNPAKHSRRIRCSP